MTLARPLRIRSATRFRDASVEAAGYRRPCEQPTAGDDDERPVP